MSWNWHGCWNPLFMGENDRVSCGRREKVAWMEGKCGDHCLEVLHGQWENETQLEVEEGQEKVSKIFKRRFRYRLHIWKTGNWKNTMTFFNPCSWHQSWEFRIFVFLEREWKNNGFRLWSHLFWYQVESIFSLGRRKKRK